MAIDLAGRVSLDEWEAGELGVEYDDREPQEVIGWAPSWRPAVWPAH